MSIKMECHSNWNATQIGMSLKMEFHSNGMRLKKERHSNLNVTKMECNSKLNVPQIERLYRLKWLLILKPQKAHL